MSQHLRSGGCKWGWGGGHRGCCARVAWMGSGSGESPWVSSERSGHMPCVRAAGLIQELSAPPREVSDALIYKPTGSCPAPASHMQEKAHRSQDKQSQQHPCTAGGSTERAKDAPAGPPGPGGQRWPCPGTTAPGPGSNSTGCHGIHAAALRVPAVQGPLGAGGGDASGIPNSAPSAGDAARAQRQRGM